MSRLTNSAVFLVAGILIGFLCQALAPHDPVSEQREEAAMALVSSCARDLSGCAGHLGQCSRELTETKRSSIFGALQGEVR